MSDIKKFFELASKDESVRAELNKAISGAVSRVAEAHGFDLKMEEVSYDEFRAVSGGAMGEGKGKDVCAEVILWDFDN